MYDIDFDQRYWGFKRNAKKVFFKWVAGCFFFGSAMVLARGINYEFTIVACVSVFYGFLAVAIYAIAYYLRWYGGNLGRLLTKPLRFSRK